MARGQVQPSVQLDTIFNAFDPTTRTAFQTWQQQLAVAVRGNDMNLSNVLGNLPVFAADTMDILTVLDVEHASVVNLVRNASTVFGALSANQAALRGLITSSDAVFRTTADNQAALSEIFHIFPTFLDQSRLTMAQLQTFALNADPVIKGLIPVAQNLGPTLQAVRALSPDLKRLFVNLGPLITVSRTGLPATAEFLRGLGCAPGNGVSCPPNSATDTLLPALGTFLEQINPVFWWLSQHQQLLSDFISNGAVGLSGFQTTLGGTGVTCPGGVPCGHYLRQFGLTGPEGFGLYQNRDPNNRGDTYPPGVYPIKQIAAKEGLPSWDCKNAGGEHGPKGDQPTGSPSCWVAPPLPGARGAYQIPHLLQAHYPGK